MIKVGIITIARVNNYGACLQAFALQKKLSDLGCESEIIDYLYYKNPKFKRSKGDEPIVRFNLKSKLKNYVLYRIVSPTIEYILPIFFKSIRRRKKNFKRFNDKCSVFSANTYRSYQDLYSENFKYDVFVAGSDQIWNPFTGISINPYFLTFAPKLKKKVSYAASFGVSSIDNKYQDVYNELLNNIDFISVRESQGVQLVKDISNREAVHTLDPTLLLTKDEWLDILKMNEMVKGKNERYILIYDLYGSKKILHLAHQLRLSLKLPIVKICKRAILNPMYRGIKNITDAGPLEFLALFMNASYVLTNSFHGTAYSVNFQVPFYTVLSSTRTNNSRIEDFLGMLNMKDRIVMENEILDNNIINTINKKNSVSVILDEKVKFSIDFFKKSIGVLGHFNK